MSFSKSCLFYGVAGGTIIIDQITKAAARSALGDGGSVTIVPNCCELMLSRNSGAAFGMLPNWVPLFIVVALVAVYAIVRLNKSTNSKLLSIGLGMLLGGAIGNLIDRLTPPHHAVTDFINVYVTIGGKTHTWPTFNVADIGIVAGAILLIFYVHVVKRLTDEDARRLRETEETEQG